MSVQQKEVPPGLVGGTRVGNLCWFVRVGRQDLMWEIHVGPGLGRYAPRRWLDAAPWKGLPLSLLHI